MSGAEMSLASWTERRPVGVGGPSPLPLCPQELEQQGSIHTKGCVGQFEKWLQDNLIVVAGVFVGVALLQVLPQHSMPPTPPPCQQTFPHFAPSSYRSLVSAWPRTL